MYELERDLKIESKGIFNEMYIFQLSAELTSSQLQLRLVFSFKPWTNLCRIKLTMPLLLHQEAQFTSHGSFLISLG